MTARPRRLAPRVDARGKGRPAADAGLWERLAALEGQVLASGNRKRFVVLAVTALGVYVRSGAGQAVLLGRRALAEALPYAGAGEPVSPRRRLAPRLAAVLRAAGIEPGA